LTTPSKQIKKSLVIKLYVNGKPRDDIANEVGLSAGTVSNTIKEWKLAIGNSDATEIRDFSVMVKKSGISILQCVQGFRMVHLLKNLGIKDTDEAGNGDYDATEEVISFLNIVHNDCKKLGISPEIIPTWIKDLLDCCDHDIMPSTQIPNRVISCYNANTPVYCNGAGHMDRVSHNYAPKIEMPFVSKVSEFMSQTKAEVKSLEECRSLLKKKYGN
jgi:hypothetical protein